MPIVPTFQGGLPQVQDSGSAGMAPISAPQIRTDYDAVMKKALMPVQDWANSAVKALEVQRARVIKAESDDAEREVMGVIDTHLNNPETGYLTKMGRHAMDGYQPAMEAMTRDVNEIVGKLSPQAREAVQSRVYDRMQSAHSQAQRWNANQTRQYQLQSSSSKVEALQADAANHYADPEYLAKSSASVEMELAYQAQLMGWDDETLSNQKRAHLDQLQANRFSAWAQDDPVSAFEALISTPDDSMSMDIRRKLEDSLWRQSKGLLAAELAAKHPLTGDKNELWGAIKSEKTGIPLIDELTQVRRAELFASVWTQQKTAQSGYRQDLAKREKNSLALIGETGVDADMLSRDQFVEAYGESEGSQRYESYKANAETVAAIHGFSRMPVDAMNAVIEASAPVRGAEDYADQVKRRDALVKARDEVTKQRRNDPIAYAMGTGSYDVQSIDFDNLQSVVGQISIRAQNAKTISTDYGTKAKIFSLDEVSKLKTKIDGLGARERSAFLGAIADVVGADGVGIVHRQLGEEYSTGFLLAADPSMRANGVAENYFLGKAGIAEKQTKVGIVTSPSTGIPLKLEALNGLIDNSVVREKVVDSITAVAAGKVMSGTSAGEAMTQAMTEIVGEIYDYNGRKVALKDGVRLSDLEDAVRSNVRSFERLKGVVAKLPNGMPLTGEQVAKLLPDAELRMSTTGEDNTFDVILSNGQKLIQSDGSPFTIKAVNFEK